MNNEKFIKTSKPKDKLIKHASLITYSAFRINIKTTNKYNDKKVPDYNYPNTNVFVSGIIR